jgi:surface polysaccharide O-acyltransferase-like enzyme
MNGELLDWLLDHHRNSYRYQLEQRDKIQDRASFLSTPLTLLGTGIIYVATHFHENQGIWRHRTFYALIAVAAALFVFSVLFVISAVVRGSKYSSVLSPASLHQYAIDLAQHSEQTDGIDVLQRIKQNLADRYSAAATQNWEINVKRSRLLVFGTNVSALAFASFLVALIPFFWE